MEQHTDRFYEFSPFRIDPLKRLLLRNGTAVPLTPKAFDILLALVEKSGRVLEKDQLMRLVWPDTVVEENNLTRNISTLRKTLGESPDDHRYIVTVPGRGYSFVAEVQELPKGDSERLHTSAGAMPKKLNAGRIGLAFAAAITILAVAGLAYLRLRRTLGAPFQRISLTRLTVANGGNSASAAISPDGKYLAYAVGDAGQQSLWVRLLATGSEIELIRSAEVLYGGLTFSRDGNYLHYQATDRTGATVLYRVPVLGGASIKLEERMDSPISLSPDGSRFAFIREDPELGESVLVTVSADGASERKVGFRRLPERFDYPAWSPDGKSIACTLVGTHGSGTKIVEVRLENGAQKTIGARTWSHARRLTWLRDGNGLIMSARDGASDALSIWNLTYPSGEARRITHNLEDLVQVSVTGDSSTLLTVEAKLISSVWIASSEETNGARQIPYGASKHSIATWTTNGKILYDKQLPGSQSIWVMDPDGSNQKQLTVEDGRRPAVCADGLHVVYLSLRNRVFDIWKMGIDGSDARPLVPGSGDTFPQCSPDGKWVVYTSVGSGRWPTLRRALLDRTASGDLQVQLSDKVSARPAISPDGRLIACFYLDEHATPQRDVDKAVSMAVIPMEGGAPLKVFNLAQTVYEPAGIRWTPDGTALAYVDNRGAISNIWIQPIDGSPPRQLTDFKGDRIFHFDWSRDGKQLVFSRGTRTYDLVLIRDLTRS